MRFQDSLQQHILLPGFWRLIMFPNIMKEARLSLSLIFSTGLRPISDSDYQHIFVIDEIIRLGLEGNICEDVPKLATFFILTIPPSFPQIFALATFRKSFFLPILFFHLLYCVVYYFNPYETYSCSDCSILQSMWNP